MSYEPTEWAPQTPADQPSQPPVTPPTYGQAPQPPVPPVPQQEAQPQYAAPFTFPPYGQEPVAPAYGQPGHASNPALPPYGQPGQAPQAPAGYPAYGQPGQIPAAPTAPGYGQPGQASNPALPPYGQPGQAPQMPGYPAPAQYGASSDATQAAMYPPSFGASADPTQAAAYPQPQYGVPPMQAGMYPQQAGWGEGMPPGYMPAPVPPTRKRSKAGIIITVIVLIVLLAGGGAGGYAYYLATRPKPVITITSKYLDGATKVGATSTSFTLTGTDFTQSSAITFLLDGAALPGAPTVISDSKGDLTTTLTITTAWTVGMHTITAKDASGYLTKAGVKVEIVVPGKSNTPGPNGAPTDTANMTIVAAIQTGGSSDAVNLTVQNGSVCGDKDNSQPQTNHGTATNGVTYTGTIAFTCTGTYQGGQLTYTETATKFKVVYSDGLVCQAPQPFVYRHLEGTFNNTSAVSGSFSADAVSFDCNMGVGTLPVASAATGTWTGVAVVQ